MLTSILQSAGSNGFQNNSNISGLHANSRTNIGHHTNHNSNSKVTQSMTSTSTGPAVQTNVFLRPTSAYTKERKVSSGKPEHSKDPRLAAQNHLERTVNNRTVANGNEPSNGVNNNAGNMDPGNYSIGTNTQPSNSASIVTSSKSSVPVANGYSITSSSNIVARMASEGRLNSDSVFLSEDTPPKAKPIINDITTAHSGSSPRKAVAVIKLQNNTATGGIPIEVRYIC